MMRIGYATVSSTGQSIKVQLEKLNGAACDRIYRETPVAERLSALNSKLV